MTQKSGTEIWPLLQGSVPFISDLVRNQDVLDIGCASSSKSSTNSAIQLILPEYGIRDYTGIDIHLIDGEDRGTVDTTDGKLHKVQFIETDALSHLAKQPEESLVITANAIFDEPLSPYGDNSPEDRIKKEYLRRVMRQIYRVTHSFLFGFSMGIDSREEAKEAGFKEATKWKDGIDGLREYRRLGSMDRILKGHKINPGNSELFRKLQGFYVLKK